MVEKYKICEARMIHERWERISSENGVLDVANTPGERKVLALILEDRRLRTQFNYHGQYERIYRPAIGNLHDHHYHHCMKLASKVSDNMIK
jgi:hypothetical protein